MALVPTRQFYPTSFFFDSFHGTQVRFLRCGSSITFKKKHTFYATQQQQYSDGPNSLSSTTKHNNPRREYKSFKSINQKNNRYKGNKVFSSGNWIEKWNDNRQPNRVKPPRALVDYEDSESENEPGLGYGDRDRGVSDGNGVGSTMEKIVEKLKKFGYMDGESGSKVGNVERVIEKGSVEDIFYVEEGLLPNSRGGFSAESPLGDGNLFGGGHGGDEVRFPWETPKKVEGKGGLLGTRSGTFLAELTLPESELKRLRYLTFMKKHKTRIRGAGVTQEVVNMIHETWKKWEIVKLKIEGPPALNMKRMHEILERKTGGLVIWRSGTSLSLYRGVSYEVPALHLNEKKFNRSDVSSIQTVRNMDTALEKLESSSEEKKDTEKPSEVHYEVEMEEILDSLGPRYTDWPGPAPLPVDADLLPGRVYNYQPPFRILPYGVRRSLRMNEATSLRRLARVLPPHFALGRSRQLQGLAMAIIKLWEKSSIAKVALKRGVQLTTSERMAEEIKQLTGGVLLSRNKDFLIFYRGNDFLAPEVTEALLERERLAKSMQDEEEQARLRASAIITPEAELTGQSATAGTLGETLDAYTKWGKKLDSSHREKVMRQVETIRHAKLVRKLENSLALAERKLMKAERALGKVEAFLQPANPEVDPESITDEERFMFRKLGLRMKAFLLLGRRGVFDGTVENMHLHWKYRELVKVVVNARTFEQVKNVALALEAESGGVLVSVDRISKKKFAMIVFRGRDYKRPSTLRPKNLLTKRKALARSIELQRQRDIVRHIKAVQKKVDKLRSELEQMEMIKDQGDEALYDKLESAYFTSGKEEEDQSEEEDDEAYLGTYGDEDDGEDETNNLIRNLYRETDFPYNNQNFELEMEPVIPELGLNSVNGSLMGDEKAEEEHNHDTSNSAYTVQNDL